jgi:hypothetical protein
MPCAHAWNAKQRLAWALFCKKESIKKEKVISLGTRNIIEFSYVKRYKFYKGSNGCLKQLKEESNGYFSLDYFWCFSWWCGWYDCRQ